MNTLHVAVTGSDHATGRQDDPLRTINAAARLAQPGDTVRVHEGTYREWVTPVRGGLSDESRITFEAAEGEQVTIKGSERITGWVNESGTVWRADLPTSMFGGWNPYVERVWGDWIVEPDDGTPLPHLGDVYLEGRSFYEVFSRSEVDAPAPRTHARDQWTGLDRTYPDPAATVYVWYTETHGDTTTIWANFQGADPNERLVEINVRRSVFYPEVSHLDYITVRGFELAHAACPWTPPTADQPGLIGPNWAKGWIIEDNVIHDAKCSAISLGKERSTGHNNGIIRGDKPGYQYQLETVHLARERGWDKEHVGSHIVRRNEIYDCGQNGIVGHLGCIFSVIEDNHIHHIGTKYEFYGYEIGGIKFHAPIDTQITHNRIHDTTLGMWLDWQVQGTRINRNLMYGNGRDIFIEVTHGPCTVDHNVFASPVAVELFSQGNAFVNNLVLGSVRIRSVLDRATPYHFPHSTRLAGYAFVHTGDDRWLGNMFVGAPGGAYDHERAVPPPAEGYPIENYGTGVYDGFPASWDEYLDEIGPYNGVTDHRRYFLQRQAAYVSNNAYAGGAKAFEKESGARTVPDAAHVRVVDHGDQVFLECRLPDTLTEPMTPVVTGAALGRVRLAEAGFENPDGTPVVAATDINGAEKDLDGTYPAGPLSRIAPGTTTVQIWPASTTLAGTQELIGAGRHAG